MSYDISKIRNICIIAHIDHGKSTLADRMLQLTHSVADRDFRDQLLDSMDLERERGITIKSHPVTMRYTASNGAEYEINLIDTPGHVDFTYEVSRSMAACNGAILLVDAAQGVEAQTVANTYLALEHNLEILPALNKTDLPTADTEGVTRQIEDVLGVDAGDGIKVSAKTGAGVPELMEVIVNKIPAPETCQDNGVRALIFDSVYNPFRGVVTYIRIVDGEIKSGDKIKFLSSGLGSEVKEVGVFSPGFTPTKILRAGQVGYLIGTIKDPADILIGDTITTQANPASDLLPGFKKIHPMVYSSVFPVNTADYERLKTGIDKLRLNDSAFTYQAESSIALGFGFRCGFLGLLHLEIVQERLRREYDLDIISTYPTVVYHVMLKNGETIEVDNPAHLPDMTRVEYIEEPMIKANIICANENIGDIMKIVMDKRGSLDHTDSIDHQRLMLICTMPLNEILFDFYDQLKSVSHGYASVDYEHTGYIRSDLVKLDILVNGETVDAFSSFVHKSKAESRGRQICKALKQVIPKHQFAVPIQAAVGKTVIARETIGALRKDVTAKCYGGDISRKRKLLERQKEGKKRMKQIGQVNVPQEAFVSVLRASDS